MRHVISTQVECLTTRARAAMLRRDYASAWDDFRRVHAALRPRAPAPRAALALAARGVDETVSMWKVTRGGDAERRGEERREEAKSAWERARF